MYTHVFFHYVHLLCAGGIDHVRVHPKFLHSNATSHKWVLGGTWIQLHKTSQNLEVLEYYYVLLLDGTEVLSFFVSG